MTEEKNNWNNFVIGPTVLHICIDSHGSEDAEAEGSISGTALEETSQFRTLQEMMLLIEKLLDRIGRPQASRETRTYSSGSENDFRGNAYNFKPEIFHTSEEILSRRGKAATWNALFRTRYHSSWQGTLYDNNGRKKGDFDSDLQLIELLEGKFTSRQT